MIIPRQVGYITIPVSHPFLYAHMAGSIYPKKTLIAVNYYENYAAKHAPTETVVEWLIR